MISARGIGWIAAVGLSLACVQAQDDPATTQEQDEAAKAQEQDPAQTPEQEEPEEQEIFKALPNRVIDVGWQNWDLDGNHRKFFQYATPPKGIHLRQLRLGPPDYKQPSWALIDLRGVGEDDYLVLGALSSYFGTTYGTLTHQRNRFYDQNLLQVNPSSRESTVLAFRQAIAPQASASFEYRADQVDRFTGPAIPDQRYRTQQGTISIDGDVLGGNGTLSYTSIRYYDRRDVTPDIDTDVVRAEYGRTIGQNVNLEGSLARAEITPDGGARNRIDTAALTGGANIGENTGVQFFLARQWVDLPTVQTARVTERNMGRLRLTHRFGGWLGEIGYKTMQVERIRGDRSWEDAPRWNTFEGRLVGRVLQQFRVTLKGSVQDVDGYAISNTEDPRPLYWSQRTKFQGRIDTGNEMWSGYLTFTHRKDENDDRATEVKWQNLTLGGSLQPMQNLTLYAEYAHDRSTGRSAEFDNPSLNSFLPDGRVAVVGLSWAINPAMYLTLDYTDFVTDNDNPLSLPEGNVRGRFLTSTFTYRMPQGIDIDLTFAPWYYKDRVIDQVGYDTTVFGISARGRF